MLASPRMTGLAQYSTPEYSKYHQKKQDTPHPRIKAIPHNSKCRYGERGAADAKPKTQIILDAAKVSAASGGNSEPKQGQRSQSARGFCPRSTMRVTQPDIIEHFGNADAVPQPPERCLSRKAGIVRCCPKEHRSCPPNYRDAVFGNLSPRRTCAQNGSRVLHPDAR